MIKGLVIGKFMPLHKGHIALIEFAVTQCDELWVSVGSMEDDKIDGAIRFNWVQAVFENHPKIKVKHVITDFNNKGLPLNEATSILAKFIGKHHGKIDILFSSEDYGEPLAGHLGAKHILFDHKHNLFPVSGSEILKHPFRYWEFLPENVRPYFVKKICIYGPESTGKSSMAAFLAYKFNTVYVHEVARDLITTNDFNPDDIIKIGQKQNQAVLEKVQKANKILFCDTDVITTQVYSDFYLKEIPEVLYSLEQEVKYDAYFLMNIDVPWVPDGLRDLWYNRGFMFERFRTELEKRKIPYVMVSGNWQQRKELIEKKVNEMLLSLS